MKRILKMAALSSIVLGLTINICGDWLMNSVSAKTPEVSASKLTSDKYTSYIKNYVGKNCASFGYVSLGGERRDTVGNSNIVLRFISEDGKYLGVEDDELKDYYVTAQSVKKNTEVKMTYDTDENGVEDDTFTNWCNVDEVALKVKKVSLVKKKQSMTQINISPDKYTYYVRDYVGRNLKDCGYVSLGGDYRDKYGDGTIRFILNTEDGSYVDLENEDTLKNYVVTSQNVSPNSEFKCEYQTDENGQEYGFTSYQSL